MRIVTTEDGTQTFYNEEHQEPYHSKSGAYDESVQKYVKPCNIKNESVILDFCFGLGYNTLAAIASYDNLTITAIENDPDLILALDQITFEEPLIQVLFEQMVLQLRQGVIEGKTDFIIVVGTSSIRFLLEDVQTAMPKLKHDFFDAVFYDPFSPKKQPELWSVDMFKQCYNCMKSQAILSTYSYARMVRDNISEAGFTFADGPIVGRRSPGSLGIKNEEK